MRILAKGSAPESDHEREMKVKIIISYYFAKYRLGYMFIIQTLGKNHLSDPEPDPLSPIPREALRPLNSIQRSLASIDIRLCRVAPVGAFEHFPEEEETEVNRDLMIIVSKDVPRTKTAERLTPI